jgi:hypothetical protein
MEKHRRVVSYTGSRRAVSSTLRGVVQGKQVAQLAFRLTKPGDLLERKVYVTGLGLR